MKRYDKLGLTKRERDILDYIITFKMINGFSPTISEIADALITSRSFVREAIYKLNDKGFLSYHERKRRSIVVKKIV